MSWAGAGRLDKRARSCYDEGNKIRGGLIMANELYADTLELCVRLLQGLMDKLSEDDRKMLEVCLRAINSVAVEIAG